MEDPILSACDGKMLGVDCDKGRILENVIYILQCCDSLAEEFPESWLALELLVGGHAVQVSELAKDTSLLQCLSIPPKQ